MLPDGIIPDKVSLFSSQDERGLSPMVGVIVLVAIVVLLGAGIAAFSLGMLGDVSQPPQATLQVTDATDGSTDEIFIEHGGGAEIQAQDTIIKVKRDGSTLVTLDEGNDVSFSVGDSMNISSDGSGTTVNFAGSAAFSDSSNGFDLNNGEVKIIVIDSNSDKPIGTLTADT